MTKTIQRTTIEKMAYGGFIVCVVAAILGSIYMRVRDAHIRSMFDESFPKEDVATLKAIPYRLDNLESEVDLISKRLEKLELVGETELIPIPPPSS